MKLQKSKKNKSNRIQDRWHGYYSEDLDCIYCLHWKGKRKGCPLSVCAYEEEKHDALANGRIKRREGLGFWVS